MNDKIKTIANQSLQNEPISREDAHYLMQINSDEIYDVFYWANQIRLRYFGHSIKTCSIVSAKQGRCTEDCSFCSQSARYHTGIEEFPLIDSNNILDAAKYAEQTDSDSIGIVTSGQGIRSSRDLRSICTAIEKIAKNTHVHPHGSFGILTRETAESLVK
ncbi:MAG: biotin synthase [Planctomycetota bacterium]|nr:biotin synthase [Planctomycetota bacterium]